MKRIFILALITLWGLFSVVALDEVTSVSVPASITFDPSGGTVSYGYINVIFETATHDVIVNYTNSIDDGNGHSMTFTLLYNTVDNVGTANSILSGSDQEIASNVAAVSSPGTKYYFYIQYDAFDPYDQVAGTYSFSNAISVRAQNS